MASTSGLDVSPLDLETYELKGQIAQIHISNIQRSRITTVSTPIQNREAWEEPSSPRSITAMQFHLADLVRTTDLGTGKSWLCPGSAPWVELFSPMFSLALGSDPQVPFAVSSWVT